MLNGENMEENGDGPSERGVEVEGVDFIEDEETEGGRGADRRGGFVYGDDEMLGVEFSLTDVEDEDEEDKEIGFGARHTLLGCFAFFCFATNDTTSRGSNPRETGEERR